MYGRRYVRGEAQQTPSGPEGSSGSCALGCWAVPGASCSTLYPFMSQQALARTWRPQSFSTFVGQQHVVTALSNALEKQRLHHAYLFTGTRGIGKTTIARIFAKALNCEKGIVPEPCQRCQHCEAVQSNQSMDLIEVDAASKTKVEDTRELLQNAQFSPHTSRFKIFLIDEVHMLSGHSFNALLKTLEEPPNHVKFLLATTDPDKLPITVLSRCLQFHLTPLSQQEISDHIAMILKAEAMDYEPEALAHIAQLAKGSLRDALSCTDQLIALGDGHITEALTMQLLGLSAQHQIENLLCKLIAGDANAVLSIMDTMMQHGLQPKRILSQLMQWLHQYAMTQVVSTASASQPFDHLDAWSQLTKTQQQEAIMLYYQIALTGMDDLHRHPTPQMGLEMTLLHMLAFHPKRASSLTTHAATPETTALERQTVKTPPQSAQSRNTPRAKPPAQQKKAPVEPPSTLNQETWPDFALALPLTGMTKALVSHLGFESYEDQHLILTVESSKRAMLHPQHIEKIKQALHASGVPATVEVIKQTPQSRATQTAHDRQKERVQQAHEHANNKAHADPTVRQVLDTFEGKVVAVETTE